MCSRRGRSGWVVALVLLGLAGAVRADDAPAFHGERALGWVHAQCDLGPRPPGSAALESLRQMIIAHADSLGLSAVRLEFTTTDPWRGGEIAVCNIIVSAGPTGGPHLWLGAHYDTRPAADRDADPQRRDEPILGANDGGSGTGILLHLMDLLAARPPARGVDLIFLDAEDSGPAGDPQAFCLGSQHLAAHWRDFGNPLATGDPVGLVVLDMCGRTGARLLQEGYSRQSAPDLVDAVYGRAADLGLTTTLPLAPGPAVFDDHVPFLLAGIPAVDLIEFPFPEWHTTGDVPAICGAATLGAVGTLVASLCYVPAPGF